MAGEDGRTSEQAGVSAIADGAQSSIDVYAGAMAKNEHEPATADSVSEAASLAETLGEAFSHFLAIKNTRLLTIFLVALSVASFGWVIESILPLVQEFGPALWARVAHGQPLVWDGVGLARLSTPACLFIFVLGLLVVLARRKKRRVDVGWAVPAQHKGLIVMLSTYGKRGVAGYESPNEIAAAMHTNKLDISRVLGGCNWGQVAFAAGYHAPYLERCWIIVTKDGSAAQFEMAGQLVRHIVRTRSKREVECLSIEIDDGNDVGHTTRAVSAIYNKLAQDDALLKPADVIADFTGGTAAMSGGLILAALQAGEKIEYIRQGVGLTADKLDAGRVQAEGIIISPYLSMRMAVLPWRRS